MSQRPLSSLAVILLCGALIVLAFRAGGPQEMESSEATTQKKGSSSHSAIGSPRPDLEENAVPKAGKPTGLPAEAPQNKELVLEAIHDASTTYNPAELPKIQPYLLHPDPEIREAALNGIVNLGDAAGAPLLRAAAKQTSAPQEAVRLLEMADYLELPSVELLNVNNKGSTSSESSPSGE